MNGDVICASFKPVCWCALAGRGLGSQRERAAGADMRCRSHVPRETFRLSGLLLNRRVCVSRETLKFRSRDWQERTSRGLFPHGHIALLSSRGRGIAAENRWSERSPAHCCEAQALPVGLGCSFGPTHGSVGMRLVFRLPQPNMLVSSGAS